MYVTVAGPHGIGKTTSCKEISKKAGYEYIPEIQDNFLPPPQLGYKSPEKMRSQL